jgi:hypothetical protein
VSEEDRKDEEEDESAVDRRRERVGEASERSRFEGGEETSPSMSAMTEERGIGIKAGIQSG